MATSTAPSPARTTARPAKKENLFTRHIGPLPMWVWLVIAAGLVIAYGLYEAHKANSSTAATTANASEVPQFVNQTYVSGVPPAAQPGGSGSSSGGGSSSGSTPPASTATGSSGNPNHITPAEGAQVATALPGTQAAGAVNLAATGIGNQYNTTASKARAQKRKNARIAARKKKTGS